MPTNKKLHYTGLFLILMHVSGFIGMQFDTSRAFFEMLTPLNLLVSTSALLYFQGDFSKKFVFVSVFVALSGFFVEVAGVHTEMIFGKYAYGQNLGFKLWEVPLLIGVNWWMLVYCFGILAEKYFNHLIFKTLFTATNMVFLDILIEPVAIEHDLWNWFGQNPPLQNYVAWFICAFILAFVFHSVSFKKQNRLVIYLLIAQFLFFGLHWF